MTVVSIIVWKRQREGPVRGKNRVSGNVHKYAMAVNLQHEQLQIYRTRVVRGLEISARDPLWLSDTSSTSSFSNARVKPVTFALGNKGSATSRGNHIDSREALYRAGIVTLVVPNDEGVTLVPRH